MRAIALLRWLGACLLGLGAAAGCNHCATCHSGTSAAPSAVPPSAAVAATDPGPAQAAAEPPPLQPTPQPQPITPPPAPARDATSLAPKPAVKSAGSDAVPEVGEKF